MKIDPEILATHAQFGGDILNMQGRYDAGKARTMIEVAPNLFVGNAASANSVLDRADQPRDDWYVISAAKDPWHRQALGYTGRGAPKDSPEYLFALRPCRLILNLVDTADPAYINDDVIEMALKTIDIELAEGKKVLIHCNEGKSRAPTIAMLWMSERLAKNSYRPMTVSMLLDSFKEIYHDYEPAEGMRLYAQRWLEKKLASA